MKIHLPEFTMFLIKAKKNSFAGDATCGPPLRPYSKNYVFDEFPFHYEDQYFGESVDVGEEVVWYKSLPIWGMGYRGGIVREFLSICDEAFGFLRQVLLHPDERCPCRGPSAFHKGDFTYINLVSGDITGFTGKEHVYFGTNLVCYRDYVGGLIRGRHNANLEIVHE